MRHTSSEDPPKSTRESRFRMSHHPISSGLINNATRGCTMASRYKGMCIDRWGSQENRWVGKFHRKVFDYKFEFSMGFPRCRGYEAGELGDEAREKEELDKDTHR